MISGANSFLAIGSTLRLGGPAGRVSGSLTVASFTLEMGNFDSLKRGRFNPRDWDRREVIEER